MPLVGAGHAEITPLRVTTCKSQNQGTVSSASLGDSLHGPIREQSLQLCSNPQGMSNSALHCAGQLSGRVAACLHLRQHHQLWLRALVSWLDLKLLSKDIICQRQHDAT